MIPLLLTGAQAALPYRFEVHPTNGLQVWVRNVPVIDGTWFQVYEPDWSKQHFSSGRGGKVETAPDGTVTFTFRSADGLVSGRQVYRPEGDRLRVQTRFEWAGEKPVRVETTAGMLNAAAVQAGRLEAEGAVSDLASRAYPTKADVEARRLAKDTAVYKFSAPLADVEARSNRPLTLFDARGYDQEWAKNRSLFWLGVLEAEVSRDRPFEYETEWRFAPKADGEARRTRLNLKAQPIAVEYPDETPLPLVPKPKVAKLNFNRPVEVTGAYRFPVGRVRFWEEFKAGLSRRFIVPSPGASTRALSVDAGVSKLGKQPGGYEITIRPDGRVSVLGEEDEGLRNGLRRLANLAFLRNGRLWLPTGELKDEPSVAWRGVHLFVGPEARQFQGRLWDRVLSPMGFNKVVLQCERAQWKSFPVAESEQPMALGDLKGLFDDYRKRGVEPIPLIQSLGHMYWFFAGNRRQELALFPDADFTLDSRKPEAVQAMNTLWDEAAALLKPKMIHFGCDEIDLRGFPPNSQALTTEIWGRMMPELGKIAAKHGAKPMIWGDKGLAPGEAIDATHGHTRAEAEKRRAAIPKGTWIADWHYRDDPRPEVFYPSLQLWKREGFVPVASGWYRPGNVRGFALAADLERSGYLQTTWAGYQSNEANMLRNIDQFSAMILAADYAWSGRQESLDKLGYDAGDLFRRMFYGRPSALSAVRGRSLGEQSPFRVGRLAFSGIAPTTLRSLLTREGAEAAGEIEIPIEVSGGRIAVAIEATVEAPDGEALAEIVVESRGGRTERFPIQYGRHVRTAADRRLVPFSEREGGRFAVLNTLSRRSDIRSVRVVAVGPFGGVRLHGISIW